MLQMNHVSYRYDKQLQDTIKNVTLDFDKGQITGILGANGSGKSTLMRLIMGLYQPNQGHIVYNGKPLIYTKKDLYAYRQEVCIVFQDSEQQLFYALVEEDVALALKNLNYQQEEIHQRVDRALEKMHITHLRKQPIHYLSFGQKKRVAVSGVLALQPHYLLLDEPTAGLDPRGRKQMLQLMKELANQGTKIILTSHDMDLMYDCCEYAYVLHEGQVVEQGTKEAVFLNSSLLEKVGLATPWVVKLHQQLGLPLYPSKEAFFQANSQF